MNPTCPAHADLLRTAQHCQDRLTTLEATERHHTTREQDHTDARHMLERAAEQCRRAASAFDLDPTLADEAWIRESDVLVELARQLTGTVPRVVAAPPGDGLNGRDGTAHRRMWHEAHQLAEHLPVLADRVLARARPDHDTPAGQQAISLTRLQTSLGGWPDSLAGLRRSLGRALAVEHPHPQAKALAELLDHITERVATLQAEAADQEWAG